MKIDQKRRLVVVGHGPARCVTPCLASEWLFNKFGYNNSSGKNVRGPGSGIFCPACKRGGRVLEYRFEWA